MEMNTKNISNADRDLHVCVTQAKFKRVDVTRSVTCTDSHNSAFKITAENVCVVVVVVVAVVVNNMIWVHTQDATTPRKMQNEKYECVLRMHIICIQVWKVEAAVKFHKSWGTILLRCVFFAKFSTRFPNNAQKCDWGSSNTIGGSVVSSSLPLLKPSEVPCQRLYDR
jgi:hypothetical protein